MCNIRNCKNSKLPPSACLARRAAPKRNRKEVCLSLQTVNVGGAPRTTPCTGQNRGWVKCEGDGPTPPEVGWVVYSGKSKPGMWKAATEVSYEAP